MSFHRQHTYDVPGSVLGTLSIISFKPPPLEKTFWLRKVEKLADVIQLASGQAKMPTGFFGISPGRGFLGQVQHLVLLLKLHTALSTPPDAGIAQEIPAE